VATARTTSSTERAVNAPAGSTGAASWKEAPACAYPAVPGGLNGVMSVLVIEKSSESPESRSGRELGSMRGQEVGQAERMAASSARATAPPCVPVAPSTVMSFW
jgi:hypothetical protein